MIAQRLKQLRLERGMNKKEAAELFNMPYTTYNNYETGAREPNFETLIGFAKEYKVSVDYILGTVGEEERESIYQYDNIFPIRRQKIRMLGEISCGKPIFANEDFDSYVECGTDVRADFCVRAVGDSMINARIHDGDIVFIREQPDVENGEIAAVVIEDMVTLKRVYKKPNSILLMPENPAYEPQIYTKEELDQIRILGKAVAFQSDIK